MTVKDVGSYFARDRKQRNWPVIKCITRVIAFEYAIYYTLCPFIRYITIIKSIYNDPKKCVNTIVITERLR